MILARAAVSSLAFCTVGAGWGAGFDAGLGAGFDAGLGAGFDPR